MKPAGSAPFCAPAESIGVSPRRAVVLKLADYLQLTKPRIALLALVTVTVGYALSHTGPWQSIPLLHALFGIALVAAGSSALNQFGERRTDACMQRTADRPLPAGRLSPGEVLLFGVATGGLGSLYLAVWVNSLTAILAVLTLLLYAAVYTPLKRVTSLCTVVGAIPGALPPVLGWTAAGSSLDAKAFSLFAILFLWQFPHSLAIGWLYRDEHSRAGLRMPPVPGTAPRVAGWMAVGYALALLPVSLLPLQFGLAGRYYSLAAIVLGVGYLLSAVRFLLSESSSTARGLFFSSLLYLPALLLTLTIDHMSVTFTADPEHDTPEVLQRYAEGRPVKSDLFPADTERVTLRRALQSNAHSESD